MEGRKQVGSSSSSSSFTSELFGSSESSSSSGIFGSIFAPPSKDLVLGRESLRSEVTGKKFRDEPLPSKPGEPGGASKESGGENQTLTNRDIISSIYQDQRVQQPCHLSSSIYYGGQEIYSHPQSTQSPGYNSVYSKDGTEDDGIASRGNWWQGSLYY